MIVNGFHAITNVRFEEKIIEYGGKIYKGLFPQFENVFRCKIPKDFYLKTDAVQFSTATKLLRERIKTNKELESVFTNDQLEDINKGLAKIRDYPWHHNEEEGILELVLSSIHSPTGHIGGRNIWGGGSSYR